MLFRVANKESKKSRTKAYFTNADAGEVWPVS